MPDFHLFANGPRPYAPFSHAVRCRCFLTWFEQDDAAFNETCQSCFPEDRRPAHTIVGTTALAVGALVEIDCIARRS